MERWGGGGGGGVQMHPSVVVEKHIFYKLFINSLCAFLMCKLQLSNKQAVEEKHRNDLQCVLTMWLSLDSENTS